jgi:hypothetical protein
MIEGTVWESEVKTSFAAKWDEFIDAAKESARRILWVEK